MDALLDSNALVDTRLSSSQNALGQMSDAAQTMLDAFITTVATDDPQQIGMAQTEIEGAFQAFTGNVNLAANGEYLFGGINTGEKPLSDYLAGGSPAKAAFDAAYTAKFGSADPSTISVAEMTDFLDNEFSDLFDDANWKANWSVASDTPMTSRINGNEVVETSTTANVDGMRKFAMAAVLGIELLGKGLSDDVRSLVNERATSYAGEAITALDGERGRLGFGQARVKKANDSLHSQKDIITTQIGNLEGVNQYEAASRVNMLTTQIEASYSLTARIQQLSLVNFL
jgi:flagellar hook-associated protein 3 FlgL